MPNFKLLIEYQGTNYAGWQFQKNQKTVQGEIAKILKKIFGKKLKLIGSGRTDTGVHAFGQVANFSVETKFKEEKIRKALNFHLPEDIRIKSIARVHSDFHSRFSAKGKIYHYVIINKRSSFLKDKAYFYPSELDLKRMNESIKYLLGQRDFSSLQNRGSIRKSAVINLRKIKINSKYLYPAGLTALIIAVEADAFLYRMVRNLVGLLLEVGRGKISPENVKAILEKRDRRYAPVSVPAHGLYLYKVKY